ncbi:MAG: spondin domain-containing protein [Winogradskyella sp.]|nr:spondin domain-containing protein [Winogradskyella sp.]
MKKITLKSIFVVSFLFSVCSNAQSTATYDISFTSTWNSTDHGVLPSNAHWSNLVGANHNGTISFLELGSVASAGIEGVAETGSNSVFNAEVQSAIDAGNAEHWLQEPFSPFAAISSATLTDVVVSEDYPLITLVSMIAPSPDWIIAVNSLDLWNGTLNQWKATFEVDLFPYDAGTENGFTYSGDNAETNPRGVIANIAGASGYPFNSEKIGTLTLTFKSTTLGIANFEDLNEVHIYPNPVSNGEIILTNATLLSAVEVYDVLGKKVKHVLIDTVKSTQHVAINDLKKGVYILRLINESGSTESKKLLVN